MEKMITVKEVSLSNSIKINDNKSVKMMSWDEEPFINEARNKKRRVIKVISIKFNGTSNRVKDVDLRAYSISK